LVAHAVLICIRKMSVDFVTIGPLGESLISQPDTQLARLGERMRPDILFLDQFEERAGAQQCLLDLLPAVVAHGWKATVMAPGYGALAEGAVALGANFRTVRCGPFTAGRKSLPDALRFARQMPDLAKEIAGCPAALIYVNGPRLLPAVPGNRTVIFHCHSFLRQRYTRWMIRRAIRRTGATVIGASRFVLAPLQHVAARAYVVYSGVREPDSARQRQQSQGAFGIGIIGRVAPQKGQAEFLRAMPLLEGCRLIIGGAPLFGDSTYLDEIRKLAANLPVEFVAWQQDVGSLLSSLDLLVVPSTVPEAAPRIIPEAFAAGVPVLAADCGGIPELIEHNRSGFLIESLAPERLAAQIRRLMERPALLAAVAKHARSEWNARFTRAEYQRRILRIIETCGGSARTSNRFSSY
jgi:glycosyltransferase involved in cell wall biosynthesis